MWSFTGKFGPRKKDRSEQMQYTVSLKLNHVFQRLYRKGKRAATPTLALYSRPNRQGGNRLGLTTGAKLGHAVVRNKLRRRLRAIYRIHESEFKPGFDIVVVCRAASVEASYRRLGGIFSSWPAAAACSGSGQGEGVDT